MSTPPNTSREQESNEQLAALEAPELEPDCDIPLVTAHEVMLSTAAAQRVTSRRKWRIGWKSRIGELMMRRPKLPPPKTIPPPRRQFLEDACMAREMRRL